MSGAKGTNRNGGGAGDRLSPAVSGAHGAKLTTEEVGVLRDIKDGADVYAYGIAAVCRSLEKRGFVRIVKAMDPPKDGKKRQPYFGAIPTPAGYRKMLAVRS